MLLVKISYNCRMNFTLTPHRSTMLGHNIQGEFSWQNNRCILRFKVQKLISSKWEVNPLMSFKASHNWGLWEHDVLELFIQKRKGCSLSNALHLIVTT